MLSFEKNTEIGEAAMRSSKAKQQGENNNILLSSLHRSIFSICDAEANTILLMEMQKMIGKRFSHYIRSWPELLGKTQLN